MSTLLDPYALPPIGIPGLDDPPSQDPRVLVGQKYALDRADEQAKRDAAAQQMDIQRQQAQQSAAEEKRRQADYDRAERNRTTQPVVPGMTPKGATMNAQGDVNYQFAPAVDPESVGELSDNQKIIANAIARYDQHPMQSLSRFHQPDREKIMAYVQTVNPAYDQKEFPVRQASRRDFTSGKAAGEIKSVNTLIHHFDGVLNAQAKLNNTGIPILNQPINYLRKEVGGNPDITAFDTNANAVAEEMAKLLKGGLATKSEIDTWKAQLDRNLAPDQLKGNIAAMMRLMAGRIEALHNQWQSAYDAPKDKPFIDEDAQTILAKHGFNPQDIDPRAKPASGAGTPPAQPNAAPAPAAMPQQPAKPRVVRQNGVTYTLQPDGQYR